MRWRVVSKRLKELHKCIVLPIGSLSSGLCRHRAILFKVIQIYLHTNLNLLKSSSNAEIEEFLTFLYLF